MSTNRHYVTIFVEMGDVKDDIKNYLSSRIVEQITVSSKDGTVIATESKGETTVDYKLIVREEKDLGHKLTVFDHVSTEISEEAYKFISTIRDNRVKYMEYSCTFNDPTYIENDVSVSIPKQEFVVRRFLTLDNTPTRYLLVLVDVTDNLKYITNNANNPTGIKISINLKKALGVDLVNDIVMDKSSNKNDLNYIEGVIISKLQTSKA